MPVFGVVMEMLEAAWHASLIVVPVLPVAAAVLGLSQGHTALRDMLGYTFNTAIPFIGEAVVYGCAFAGFLFYFSPVTALQWLVPLLVIGVAAYQEWDKLWQADAVAATTMSGTVYATVLLVSAAAVVLRTDLLLHGAATGFYAVLFWKL